jgi:hypothetical protein
MDLDRSHRLNLYSSGDKAKRRRTGNGEQQDAFPVEPAVPPGHQEIALSQDRCGSDDALSRWSHRPNDGVKLLRTRDESLGYVADRWESDERLVATLRHK